jgi:hypothetical protein
MVLSFRRVVDPFWTHESGAHNLAFQEMVSIKHLKLSCRLSVHIERKRELQVTRQIFHSGICVLNRREGFAYVFGDGSKAGDKSQKPKKVRYTPDNRHGEKGEFEWKEAAKSAYAWFNGYGERILVVKNGWLSKCFHAA